VTVELWQACLLQFRDHGTANERLMARILLEIIGTNGANVAGTFDAYASEILEAAP